jgi:hypothetical protein
MLPIWDIQDNQALIKQVDDDISNIMISLYFFAKISERITGNHNEGE